MNSAECGEAKTSSYVAFVNFSVKLYTVHSKVLGSEGGGLVGVVGPVDPGVVEDGCGVVVDTELLDKAM